MSNRTMPRIGSFAALLVGLDGDQSTACTLVLKAAGLTVVKAGHVAAALERIPVLQPYVVVLPVAMKREALDSITDRAVAVGSEVVWLEPGLTRGELTILLTNAAETAIRRAP
jgi:hypothetical protein